MSKQTLKPATDLLSNFKWLATGPGYYDLINAPLEPDRIKAAFEKFHAENPHVYLELRDLALEVKRAGCNHYAICELFGVLRYQRILNTTGDDFKLNNNYRALYARRLMRQEPELKGFFETRARNI